MLLQFSRYDLQTAIRKKQKVQPADPKNPAAYDTPVNEKQDGGNGQPTPPAVIVAPEAGFIEAGRFSFTSSLAQTEAERANPWLLLRGSASEAVPVIADATSLEYVLHAGVGDTFSIDTGAERPGQSQR